MTDADRDDVEVERARAGLCADCVHARRITSSHGSIFYLCRLADRDPAFRKYPVLPVIRCSGYVRGGQDAGLS
jgi:hypothetical protein